MYVPMVLFEPTWVAIVTGGQNECLNFVNMETDTKVWIDSYLGRGGGNNGRKIECCNCGGDHLRKNFPKLDNKKITKDKYDEWCIK